MARDGVIVSVEALCRCRLDVLVEAPPGGEARGDAARAAAFKLVNGNPNVLKHARPMALKSSWPLRATSWREATESEIERAVVRTAKF